MQSKITTTSSQQCKRDITMKITEAQIRKVIKEVFGDVSIDKKIVSGDDLVLAQLKKNSKFPWEASESSKDYNGTANFDAEIDDESYFRISIAAPAKRSNESTTMLTLQRTSFLISKHSKMSLSF